MLPTLFKLFTFDTSLYILSISMFGRNPQQQNDEKVLYNSGEKNPFSRKRLQQNQAEGGAAICRDWLVGEGKEEWKTKEDNIVIQWVSYQ